MSLWKIRSHKKTRSKKLNVWHISVHAATLEIKQNKICRSDLLAVHFRLFIVIQHILSALNATAGSVSDAPNPDLEYIQRSKVHQLQTHTVLCLSLLTTLLSPGLRAPAHTHGLEAALIIQNYLLNVEAGVHLPECFWLVFEEVNLDVTIHSKRNLPDRRITLPSLAVPYLSCCSFYRTEDGVNGHLLFLQFCSYID